MSRSPPVPINLKSSILAVVENRESEEIIPPHHHDVSQLAHTSMGVITVETDHGIWTVPPERAVWIPSCTTHSIKMSGKVTLQSLYFGHQGRPLQETRCCVVQVSPLLNNCIRRAIEFPQPFPKEGAESRLVDVILDEIRSANIAPLELALPNDSRALKVALMFRKNPADRRSHEAWASKACTSKRTLERIFCEETGMSLGKWQRQARLLRALELMANGMSITNVSLEVGFETPSAFTSMFQRALGVTPSKYFNTD